MRKAGFADKVGEEKLCPNIDAAIERAEMLVREKRMSIG